MKNLGILMVTLLITGCQNISKPTMAAPSQTLIQENPVLLDNSGKSTKVDKCPTTPNNVAVKNGCPMPVILLGTLRIEGRIFYPTNQATIPTHYQLSDDSPPSNFLVELEKMVNTAKVYPNTDIVIMGNSSASENTTESGNMALSKLRASTTKSTLIDRFGITPTHITAFGCGSHFPIAEDTTLEGKMMNRRTFLVIQEKSQDPNIFLDKKGQLLDKYKNCQIAD